MLYGCYYKRPRRTLLGSYCQGLDLLGTMALCSWPITVAETASPSPMPGE